MTTYNVLHRIAPRHWASRIIVVANEAWTVDYEDLSPEQVRLGGEMLEYLFIGSRRLVGSRGLYGVVNIKFRWFTEALYRKALAREGGF